MEITRISAISRIRKQASSSRAYTLVEMMVVIMVLALVSAAVAPSLISMKSTDERNSAVEAIRRIAADARERAIRSGQSTQIVYDEGSRQLQIQRVEDDGTTTQLASQAIPSDLEPQRYQMEGRDATSSDFTLKFTPDGHSNGGGIEFPTFSIFVDEDGFSKLIDGGLPAPNDERWQAGDLEQRA